MKNIFKSLLFIVPALVFASCDPNNGQGEDPIVTPVVQEPETHTLVFVLPEPAAEDTTNSLKTAWAAGDQIVVHGEYSKNQVVVTLAQGDIAADGKSAKKTVEGLYPYENKDCSSVLYASYPATVSDNLNHCFYYSKFSNTNEKILAAYNVGDTLKFENVCGALTFEVPEEYDGYSFTGLKKEALGYSFLQVMLTDKESNFTQYIGSPVISIDGPVLNGRVTINMPHGMILSGYKLLLKKGDAKVALAKNSEPICINRGIVNNLGAIEGIEPYDDPFSGNIKDLDAGGCANCYIIGEPGTYKLKAVKGNNATAFLDAADASILWETWNDNSEVTANSVVKSVSFAEDYMILHTPETLKAGNAVIAALDAENNVIWSWHIWVPDTEIETSTFGGLLGSTPIMDRNLGALVAAKVGENINVYTYGLTYQWGRKDPYPGPGMVASGDADPATVAGIEAEEAPGLISLEESIAHPNIMGHQNSGDWKDEFNNSLWKDDEKTIYDPCPAGYRVPAYDSSMPLCSSSLTSVTGWSVDMDKGYITIGSPAMVIPIGGYRDDYGVESFAKVGKRMALWASRNNSDIAGYHMNLRPDGGTFAWGGTGKARGCYVRCVKED